MLLLYSIGMMSCTPLLLLLTRLGDVEAAAAAFLTTPSTRSCTTTTLSPTTKTTTTKTTTTTTTTKNTALFMASSIKNDKNNKQAAVSTTTTTSSSTDNWEGAIRREINYKPGGAGTDFAQRYKHLVGKKFRTVGEAFAEFTKLLGYTVNPLYKNLVTDTVGTTHLIVVNARFQQDAIWSLGILTALDLLLKNYPEQEVAQAIVKALFKSCNLDEGKIRQDAKAVEEWAQGKTKSEVEEALLGQGDSVVAKIAQRIKSDPYWMYSRYFGIGLLKIMDMIGLEMDKDEVYPIMEDWMEKKLGRPPITACNDSDLYFKIKEKLEIMETMMKEIEIREKKRLAERLEAKAEDALRAAEKELKLRSEIDAEAQLMRDKVDA